MNIALFLLTYFERPLFILLIPLLALIPFFIYKDFVHFKDETPEQKEKRNRIKLIISLTRTLALIFIFIAFANPFQEEVTTIQGSPRIKLLIDNSTSMSLFSKTAAGTLQAQLEEQIPVETRIIAEGENSPLGSNVLNSIRKDDNALLITDGYATEGTDLGDAALYASTINATLNALILEPERSDSAVTIIGPEKVTSNAENTFYVQLSQTTKRPVNIIVTLDGSIIAQEQTDSSKNIKITKTFSDGYHKLHAAIQGRDSFSQNNNYYKTIKVVPQPNVLLISQTETPLKTLFDPAYKLTASPTIPSDLTPYTTLIFNDLPASFVQPSLDNIIDYTLDGNGLFVIGGENAYDTGGYKASQFEQLLPVFVAQPGKKKGDISIVLVIDISGSTGSTFGDNKAVDVEKALAVGILKDLALINKVGAVAFNTEAFVLGDVKPLLEHTELEDNIARLQDGGGTHIGVGLLKAIELLQNQKGSKNIILITDGKTQNVDQAEDAVRLASSQGIRLYVVGVGEGTNERLMEDFADLGNGAFYEPESKDKLKILFGDSETSGQRRIMPYVYVDEKHFISKGLTPKGNIYGFNVVAPKNTAKLIATTDTGDPLLVVSRFGLGRVAALATDDGDLYAPELLNKNNSQIYTRTLNWLIGDPERKNANFIQISDGIINHEMDVLVKSKQQPLVQGATFIKTDEDLWTTSILPKDTGYFTFETATYAVNDAEEYRNVGQNPELANIISSTSGKMFTKNQINDIIEYVRARSRRDVLQKKSYAWIFALLGLGLFLGEVITRRMLRNFNK
ncbi:MAG: VWA domain-containing protein [Candidatus Nanoarchaeia archaeon]